jgi:hypothetical protein
MADEKKKKQFKERLQKPPAALNFDALAPAIVDGKLVTAPKQQLVLRRPLRKYDITITLVHVVSLDNDGYVVLWDETLGQKFMFNLTTDAVMSDHLKIYDRSKVGKPVFHKEVKDNVPMDGETEVGSGLHDEGSDADESTITIEDAAT